MRFSAVLRFSKEIERFKRKMAQNISREAQKNWKSKVREKEKESATETGSPRTA